MKVKSFMAMLLLATSALCFSSCDDDDKEDETKSYAEQVAGSYTCESNLENAYMSLGYYATAQKNVTLTYADNKLSGEFETHIGTISFSNIAVENDGTTYTLTDNEGSISVSMPGSTTSGSYVTTLSGTITAGKLVATCKITMGAMGEWTIYYNNIPSVETAKAIVGTYGDYSLATAKYFTNMYTKESGSAVTITEVTDTTVNVAFESATWGTFSFENVVVKRSGTTYTISGEGTVEMAGMGGTVSTYDATVEGSFSGKEYTLVFTAPSVMGGTAISVYTGSAPAYATAGKYGTYSLTSCAYFKNMFTDETDNCVVVTGTSTDSVSVAFTSATWGTFTIAGAVKADGDVYTISGNGTCEMSSHGSEAKTYDTELTATINGDATTFVFSIPSVMGGTTITVYNTTADAAYSVAGSYTGTLSAYLSELSMDGGSAENQTVKIAYAEDGVVSVAVPSFTYNSMVLPAATITGVAVKANEDGSYTLGESEFSETVTVDDAEKTYAGKINGTIAADGSANIVYDVKYGAMPFTITFTFKTVTE